MEKTFKNYFTTGELSKLCRIPRKTLLYYDKLGLITPEVIDGNGYRYYKRSQLFLLELILTLRKTEMPIADIKNYLENRSLDNYRKLLLDRESFLNDIIQKTIKLKTEVHNSTEYLETLQTIKINEIQLSEEKPEYIYISKAVSDQLNFKARTKISADLFIKLLEHIPLNSHTFGYIVDKKALAEYDADHFIKHYFYPVQRYIDSPNYILKPGGKYLSVYFQGIYMDNSKKYINRLVEYMKEYKFTPISDLYITSVKNFWLTDSINDYIYKLEVEIK